VTAVGRPTVLLIGGAGRSGSTLLGRLLGELPGFAAVGEFRYAWSEALAGNRHCGCGAGFRDCPFWAEVGGQAFGGWDQVDQHRVILLERSVARHRHIPLLAMGRAAPAAYRRKLDDFLRALGPVYAAVHAVSGADVIVDSSKDAAYAHVLRHLPGVSLRMVHLVRDSRGVAWSWSKVVRSDAGHCLRRFSPPVTAVRWVARNLLTESLQSFGMPRLLLRYETLVARPQEALTAIAEFAGQPLGPEALAFLDGQRAWLGTHHMVGGNPMHLRAGQIAIRLDDAWRTSLPLAQKAQVTALTWPLLRRYSRPVPAVAAGTGRGTAPEAGGREITGHALGIG
jgi:hypothetical protein